MQTSDVHTKANESLQHASARERLPSYKFMQAAIMSLNNMPPDTDSVHGRFNVLYMVLQFLKKWDPNCLTRSEVGVSKLAKSLPQLFTPIDGDTQREDQSVHGLTTETYQTLRHQFGFDVVRSVGDL